MAERRSAIAVGGQATAVGRRCRCVNAARAEARGRKGLPSGGRRGSALALDQHAGGRS